MLDISNIHQIYQYQYDTNIVPVVLSSPQCDKGLHVDDDWQVEDDKAHLMVKVIIMIIVRSAKSLVPAKLCALQSQIWRQMTSSFLFPMELEREREIGQRLGQLSILSSKSFNLNDDDILKPSCVPHLQAKMRPFKNLSPTNDLLVFKSHFKMEEKTHH